MIVNLTPHPITIFDRNSEPIKTFPEMKSPARVKSDIMHIMTIEGIPIISTTFRGVVNIPHPANGIYYIVSRAVKMRLPDRSDLLVPADIVKNRRNFVVACKSLEL